MPGPATTRPLRRLAVHSDDIPAALDPGVAVPRRIPRYGLESTHPCQLAITIDVQAAGAKLEAGDQHAAGPKMSGKVADDSLLAAGREEDHDVAGCHDHVERPAQLHGGEVGELPADAGTLAAGRVEHHRVEVD